MMLRLRLLLVSLLAGAVVLGLEVLAARTMAPFVGSGSAAWSALLAVALGSLACGNILGGWLAGRARQDTLVLWSIVLASATLAVLSRYYRPAMEWATGRPLAQSVALAAGVSQFVPMLLLGSLTPALLRIDGRPAGSLWSGAVLAFGSIGGIAGAIAVGLATLPACGTSRSFLLLAAALTASGLPVALAGRRWLAVATLCGLLAVAGWAWRARPAHEAGIVHSRYGQLEIRATDSGKVLLIDGLMQTGLPARPAPGDALRAGYLVEFPLLCGQQPHDTLVIGLGGGLCWQVLDANGVHCDSVELDPAVVQAAREHFDFRGPVAVADGRAYLRRTDATWDLIVLDVCTSERLAWHLFTVEGLWQARRRLARNGVLAIQFIGDDGPWSASLKRTVDDVFGESAMFAPARSPAGAIGPRWLFAGIPPWALAKLDGSVPLEQRSWRAINPAEPGELLTDDRFAAESAWFHTASVWRNLTSSPTPSRR